MLYRRIKSDISKFKFGFKNFSNSIKDEEPSKLELILKRYISHDTFLGKYSSKSKLNIPCGMHVSVM